jgi:hypothetical protein
MQNNTLVWTTDRSYDRKRAADLSGVGWIIFCKRTGLQMTGTFWEKNPSASSFRAEMLGLACLYLLARAVVEFFNLGQWAAVILCDNKKSSGAIIKPSSEDQTECKMRQHKMQFLSHQTDLHQRV